MIGARYQQAEACLPGGVRWSDGRCVPEGITEAVAPWVLDVAIPILAAVLVGVMVIDCIRKGYVTWWLLFSLCSALVWWMETIGDWGQHLSYSPVFNHYTLDLPLTAPHNPFWMPLMYSVYWVAHAWAILRLAQWRKRTKGTSLGKSILVLSVPLTFVWNFAIEGFAAYMGWWTYEPPIGPFIDMGRGNWPLMWPMLLMFGWINLIAWMTGPPEDEHRLNRIERLFRLDRLLSRPDWVRSAAPSTAAPGPTAAGASRAGGLATAVRPMATVASEAAAALDPTLGTARFQVVRFGSWLSYFTVTFMLCLVVPLVLVRVITGWDSFYLP